MRLRRSLLLAALALAASLLPASPAAAGQGFLGRAPLFPVPGAAEDEASGGVTAWFRVRNDRSTVQGLRIWVRGLSDAEGATLWITAPGQADAEEVADFAAAGNGSAYYELIVDSRFDDGSEVPLELSSMVKLERALIEVRIPGADLEDAPVLRGRIGDFHFRSLVLRDSAPGTRSRTGPMVPPPPPVIAPDDAARGNLRVWRRPGSASGRMGLSIFARGLTADESYEVWLEDPSGVLQELAEGLESTGDGLGYWSVDTGAGDTLPPEAGEDDVRDLRGRRIEIRRSGFADPSLVGILPRVR